MLKYRKFYFLIGIVYTIYFFTIKHNCYSEETANVKSDLTSNHKEWYEVQDLISNEYEHYHFGRRTGRNENSSGFFSFYRKYKHVYKYAIIDIGDTQVKVRFHNSSPKVGDCIPIKVEQNNNELSTITINFQKYRLNTDFNQCR